MKILQWFCKIVISICFIALLWTFLFPTFIIEREIGGQWEEMYRIRRFIFASPTFIYIIRWRIDAELTLLRAVPFILIIGVGVIFLKWRSSKKLNDLKE